MCVHVWVRACVMWMEKALGRLLSGGKGCATCTSLPAT